MENIYPAIGNITRIEYGGQPVIPTARLSEFYECSAENIRDNFRKNRERFIEGKHFFELEGDALRVFKRDVENFDIADKAWEVFEVLEDSYFSSVVERDESLPPVTDFQRGKVLAKLSPHAKDPFAKQCIVAKAANLILGED